MRIRVIKTASGKQAIQVVSKLYGVLTVHKHIGTYADKAEKARLYHKAQAFIKTATGQVSLDDHLSSPKLEDIEINQTRPLLVYQLLSNCYDKLGFNRYSDKLIKDLVIARIYRPVSKRETQQDLNELFGKKYSLKTVYRHLKQALDSGIKERFQQALVSFTRDKLKDSLRLVFYDVTTLYFDSQVRTKLKDFGFSKDHRPNKTQIVVGLVVNQQGFPLYFDVFTGKTFEGHTLITVIENIRQLLNCPELVVVADSAMLSKANIEQLSFKEIGFIVGARLGNLPAQLIDQISSNLKAEDNQITTADYRGQRLICQYSKQRANKDKSDRKRQIEKAQAVIAAPTRITGRYRFVKRAKNSSYNLNQDLITKAGKLEGIKGYLTNTKLDEKTIIDRYHDLWKIECSFRLTKSDLRARPIFHRLDETIKTHLVIVFAGLAICRYIEITTGKSIQRVLKLLSRVLTHEITNTKTGETAFIETTVHDPQLKQEIDHLRKTLGY